MTIRYVGAEVEGAGKQTGQHAHAEGGSTEANGQYSHAEGGSTTASGVRSHAEGNSTVAAGTAAHSEGQATTASANCSHAAGLGSVATGPQSHASGNYGKADAMSVWAHGGQGLSFLGATRAQVAIYQLSGSSTGTTPYNLTFDGNAVQTSGASQNVVPIPTYATYLFELKLVCRRVGSTLGSAGWRHTGLITRDTGGNCRLVGSVTQVAAWQDAAIGTVTFAANTANYLQIQVAGTTAGIQTVWHGVLTVNEMIQTS